MTHSFCKWMKHCKKKKASGIRSKIFWIHVWAGIFKINGTRHIVLPKRKQAAYYAVVAKFATTAADGKNYQVEYFNLDVIISVGYRVKLQRTSCDGQLGFDDLA